MAGVFGAVSVNPENVGAFVGENVTISCHTTSVEAVDWRRKLPPADRFQIFAFRGTIVEGYEEKFSISNPQTGSYVVLVKNVQLSDTGQYRCIEGVDDPSYGTVRLTVNGNSCNCLFQFCYYIIQLLLTLLLSLVYLFCVKTLLLMQVL